MGVKVYNEKNEKVKINSSNIFKKRGVANIKPLPKIK